MLVLSHRGLSIEHPENTLAAFRAAIGLGVDGIETDVRLSADRLPVLCHDRATPDGAEVADLTRDELALRLGHPVPTLGEALAAWPDILWNVEIKTPAAFEPALEALRGHRETRNVLVSSFWHDLIARLARAKEYPCGILLAHRPADPPAFSALLDGLPPVEAVIWHYEILDPQLLEIASRRGIGCLAYGAETRREHSHCRELALRGVITDNPRQALDPVRP